jgi:hypothetical protein
VVALATTKGTVAAGAAGEAAQSTFCCSEGHHDPSTKTPASLFLATVATHVSHLCMYYRPRATPL